MVNIDKDAFKEFSKVVLYFSNNSKVKVYTYRLQRMMESYCSQTNTKFSMDNFELYLSKMKEMPFIRLDKNIFGGYIEAKVKLPVEAYNEINLLALERSLDIDLDEPTGDSHFIENEVDR